MNWLFLIMFSVIFTIAIIVFIITFVKVFSQARRNSKAPKLTVEAKVVSKRQNYNGGRRNVGTTSYYVTFEVDSGDRMELYLSGMDYGMLVEGDTGKVTFQGTKFIEFERD